MTHAIDAGLRSEIPHVIRHAETIANQPKLKAIYGDFTYIDKALQYVPPPKDPVAGCVANSGVLGDRLALMVGGATFVDDDGAAVPRPPPGVVSTVSFSPVTLLDGAMKTGDPAVDPL